MSIKVCVALVTYNRKELLLPELDALLEQSHPISGIVIVDNNSSDGTHEALKEKGVIKEAREGQLCESTWQGRSIYYFRSPENTGGSGGFAKAFSIAEELPYDYIWAMDDDVVPETNCLELLLKHIDDDTKVCIPSRQDENFDERVVVKYNLSNPFLIRLSEIKTILSTSDIESESCYVEDFPLEGPLISMDIARKAGVPDSSYFIMYDDTDFARRILDYSKIKLVKNAVLHRMLAQKSEWPPEWNWKTYYLLRNQFVFDRRYGKNVFVRRLRPWLSKTVKVISAGIKGRKERIPAIRRAYRDAVRDNIGKTVQPGTSIEEI